MDSYVFSSAKGPTAGGRPELGRQRFRTDCDSVREPTVRSPATTANGPVAFRGLGLPPRCDLPEGGFDSGGRRLRGGRYKLGDTAISQRIQL